MPYSTRSIRPSGPLDAYRTTGPSPTDDPSLVTLQLLGPGAVGREVLRGLDPARFRVLAVSDRSGTLHHPEGLDVERVLGARAEGRGLGEIDGALEHPAHRWLTHVGADVVVDTTATLPDRPLWHAALDLGVVARGRALVLAAKDALAARAPAWLDPALAPRVGVDAVLGGTGRLLQQELAALRRRTRCAALAGNASTTTILEAIEGGATVDEGVEQARRAGLLEADPDLDLRGWDAAVKLAVVAGALLGRVVDPDEVSPADLRALDPDEVRDRASRGWTTRLVGRLSAEGEATVAYEALPLTSPLAVPAERVAYEYVQDDGRRRVHVGRGLGARGTARAVLGDVGRVAEHVATGGRARGGLR